MLVQGWWSMEPNSGRPAVAAVVTVVAVAVAVAAVGVAVSVVGRDRLQGTQERSEVRRFTASMRQPVSDLTALAGKGLEGQPGFDSAGRMLIEHPDGRALRRQAAAWEDRLRKTAWQVGGVSVGPGELFSPGNGRQRNSVGGRVRSLSSVRDHYEAAVDLYVAAAHLWELAASAPRGGDLRLRLAIEAVDMRERGQVALNTAAMELLQLHDRYHLDVRERMPGESLLWWRNRYRGAA
jgi:hypothetical protein